MNFLRYILTNNFSWKILSVGLAFVIWLTVKTTSAEQGQTERIYLAMPLQIVSSTADVRTHSMDPSVVTVTVRGRAEVVNKLSEREIHCFVDVTSTETTQTFRRRIEVAVPSGITVVQVEPADTVVTPPKTKNVINIIKP
jgi:YbbR domain-containing protein